MDLVNEQAEDEGLWFIAQTAPEAYLQQELRRLHAAIEAEAEIAGQHQPQGGPSVGSRTWSRSAAKPSTRSGVSRARPAGSWDLALDRARREWDGLAAPPLVAGRYSDTAAAAILALAVALWPSVAAELAALDDGGGV